MAVLGPGSRESILLLGWGLLNAAGFILAREAALLGGSPWILGLLFGTLWMAGNVAFFTAVARRWSRMGRKLDLSPSEPNAHRLAWLGMPDLEGRHAGQEVQLIAASTGSKDDRRSWTIGRAPMDRESGAQLLRLTEHPRWDIAKDDRESQAAPRDLLSAEPAPTTLGTLEIPEATQAKIARSLALRDRRHRETEADLVLQDPGFDDAFQVETTSPSWARQVLTAGVREALLGVEDALRFVVGIDAVEVHVEGYVADVEEGRELLRALTRLAEGVSRADAHEASYGP
ncbi:MAG: hypothetical protein R3185_00715 [Candidatus Thermoplasmatota archaeon]|nr:hypothetical protein [Candidatus Thermoplasmatota archaeon]